jgi:hypothetical protein
MKTKYALPMVLAGSVALSGCWLDDDDDPATTSVRVLHASSDAPAVNVLVNGDVVVPGADYKQAAVLTPSAGLADIAVDGLLPGGETVTVISADEVSLRSDTKYDVIAVGKLENIEPLILTDDGERESADSVRLRVAHLSPVAQEAVDGPVEVYLTAAGDPLPEEASFSFSFKESVGPIEVPAGDYQIRVAIPGETPTVVFDSGTVPLAAGSDLLVGAVDNTTPETTPDGEETVNNNSPVSLIAVTGEGQVIELFDSAQQAGVRVVHNSSDAPPVAVLVDDTVAIPSLAFPNVSPAAGTNSYAVIPDGSRNLKVSPAASETFIWSQPLKVVRKRQC